MKSESAEKVARFEALLRIGVAITSTLENETLLQLIVEQAADLMEAESCSVALLDESSGELVFRAAIDDIVGMRIPSGKGIMFRVLSRGTSEIVDDVSVDPDHYEELHKLTNVIAKSMLAVPLLIGDKSIGVLTAINRNRKHFTLQDRDLFVIMAGYAAIAIQNTRLFNQIQQQANELEIKVAERTNELEGLYLKQTALAEEEYKQRKKAEHQTVELRKRERYMAMLNEITKSAIQQKDLESMLITVANRLGELFGSDGCYFILWNENDEFVATDSAIISGNHKIRNKNIGLDEQLLTKSILKSGHPLIVEDVDSSPDISPRIAELFQAKTLFGLPLIADNRKFGAVLIAFHQPHPLSEQEISLGNQAAQQIALALAKFHALEIAEKKAKEAETLRKAVASVAETLNLSEAIGRILQQLERVVPFDSASVQLLQDNYLEIVGGRGWSNEQEVIGIRFPVPGDNPNTCVIQERRYYILRNASKEYKNFKNHPHNHVQSWLGVPLIFHDSIIGMLSLDAKQPNFFTPEHARLAFAFADQVAVAIDNARLYEESQKTTAELKIVRDILHHLNAVPQISEAFSQIANGLKELTGCDRISLALYDDSRKHFKMIALDQHPRELSQGVIMPVISSSASADILNGQPHISPDLAQEANYPAEKVLVDSGIQSRINLPLNTPSGTIGVLNLSWQHLKGYQEAQMSVLIQIADAIALAVQKTRLFEEVQRLATVDDLTGIHNRRRLLELGHIEFQRAERYNRPFSTIMFDIDHFKKINDTFGHSIGDQVLHLLAQSCINQIRGSDIFGRFGGEEFAILLPETTISSAHEVAERLREHVQNTPYQTEKTEIRITISLGVASFESGIKDLGSLLDRADVSLYEAKKAGRNQVKVFLS